MKLLKKLESFRIFSSFFLREIQIFRKNFSGFFFSYISSSLIVLVLIHLTNQDEFLLNQINYFDFESLIQAKKIRNFKLMIFFLIFSSGWFLVSKFQSIDEKENFFENNFCFSGRKYFFFLLARFFSIYSSFLLIFLIIYFFFGFLSLNLIALLISSKIIFLNTIIFFRIQNLSNSRKIQQNFSYIVKIILILINIPALILGCGENFSGPQSLILIFVCFLGLILNYALIFNLILQK